MDAIGTERHFVDHLAPVWATLPERGRFLTTPELVDHAASKGIAAEPLDAAMLRRSSPPPNAKPPQGRKALVASIGDTKIGRRLGYGDFARMEHGAGQAYGRDATGSYAGDRGNEDASLVLVPNDYSADRWRRAYPLASVVIVGCPKLDTLPQREPGPGSVVAVTFHWPCWVCAETQPAAEFIGGLAELAKHFQVIGHQHPKWVGMQGPPSKYYARLGIEFVPDFDDVCRRADLLAFDNSSVGFEFAATGRPVVVMNARGYRRTARYGLRFWDAATVGVNAEAPREPREAGRVLVEAVRVALADPPEVALARETALDYVYAYRTGAAERAAAAIAEWARGSAEVAA